MDDFNTSSFRTLNLARLACVLFVAIVFLGFFLYFVYAIARYGHIDIPALSQIGWIKNLSVSVFVAMVLSEVLQILDGWLKKEPVRLLSVLTLVFWAYVLGLLTIGFLQRTLG